MKNKSVLVTGGMGFIGSHLVHKLLSLGAVVTILDRATSKPALYENLGATRIEGDILSNEFLYNCLSNVDICFHLAAIASVATCHRDWLYSHMNNVGGFNSLLQAIRDIKKPIKLVYASSSAVYGNCNVMPLSESLRPVPISAYGADKVSNELYAMVFKESYNTPSIGLRFFNVYGKGQKGDSPYSGVVSRFMESITRKEPLIIYGDGKQTRDFIYVEDVVQALLCAAETPKDFSGVFNICTGKPVPIWDIAYLMQDIAQTNLPVNCLPARVGDVYHSYGDIRQAQKALDFTASIDLKQGLSYYMQI